MSLRQLLVLAVIGILCLQTNVSAQPKMVTCFSNTRGQYFQFGPQRIVPEPRRALVGRTFTYYPYEGRTYSEMKPCAPMTLVFSDTSIAVNQAGERYTESIEFVDQTWCQQNRLTGMRECFAVLAKDDLLEAPLGSMNDGSVFHGYVGRWLDNDFCKARVVGILMTSKTGSAGAPVH